MQQRIARYILPCASTMVGVCLTSIGLVKIIETKAGIQHVDEWLALNSMIFLGSAILAYLSLRSKSQSPDCRYEALADLLFIIGLGVMTGITLLFAYEMQ